MFYCAIKHRYEPFISNLTYFCKLRWQKSSIFTMGEIEIFYVFCRIQIKFLVWLHKKHWHISFKQQLGITKNKILSQNFVWRSYLTRIVHLRMLADDATLFISHPSNIYVTWFSGFLYQNTEKTVISDINISKAIEYNLILNEQFILFLYVQ